MYIRICVQDEFIDPYSHRVFEDIGGLRGCKSLAPNRWGLFEPGSTPAKDKLNILMRECNLVDKICKLAKISFKWIFYRPVFFYICI